MRGSRSPSVTPIAPDVRGVVVGEIEAIERELGESHGHRLVLCRVSTGRERFAVVCGAPNARVGLRAAFAPPGARLPGGRAIGVAKIRGAESQGMLCSERELGLGEEHEAGLLRPRCRRAARRRPRLAPRPRRPRAGDRDHAEPSRLPVGARRRPRAGGADRPPPAPAGRRAARVAGAGALARPRAGRGAGPVPALHGAGDQRRARGAARRPGWRRGCARAGCGRSATSWTSPTTCCGSWATRCTPSTATG